jgi:drug/metabolite transporter (DMT)-like permease
MVNGFLLTFVLLVIFFPKEVILKPDGNYILLILFSLNILFGMYIWYNAIKNKFELGKLDGIAIAIYLPLLTIGSAIFLKQKLKFLNLFGILLISIGAYFTLS